MYISDFITGLNKAEFIKPILTNRILVVQIRDKHKSSYYLELSSNGSRMLAAPPMKVDFLIEGEEQDLEDMVANKISVKQLISLGSISIKGSYRDFLKLEALIKLI